MLVYDGDDLSLFKLGQILGGLQSYKTKLHEYKENLYFQHTGKRKQGIMHHRNSPLHCSVFWRQSILFGQKHCYRHQGGPPVTCSIENLL